MERLTSEILKFMRDHFVKIENSIGIEAVNHFERRISKIGIELDHQLISGAIMSNGDNEITTV